MGVSKYIYTVYDAKTGDILAKGTAAQLAGKGLFKDAGTVSTCYQSMQKTTKPRRWRMEREELAAPEKAVVSDTPKEGSPRRMYVYKVWNAGGLLLGEGTALELVAQGVFGSETTVHESYRRGGQNERFGVAKMARRTEVRLCKPRPPKKKPTEKTGDWTDEPCRIANPTPLQLDVHDLMRYNRIARKWGKPQLSYGVWAVKGKPSQP